MNDIAIVLTLVDGIGKDKKKYYALKITHNYESGKHFTEMVFLKEREFNQLKVIYKDNVICGK